ncbi:MAG: dipeptide ABC transporter ATP-binding protein [Leptolinea sp.]|jgi:peptide/nickel transport system ATP-binding protein/oligopeptide transport system ATP-binding protein|nr:dipeptide ABC transporter ATP-binding protein [Leptolinea sp.]
MNENAPANASQTPFVSVKHLKKYFPVQGGMFQKAKDYVKAVDDVSFDILRGETLGLVGESGCGKTTLGRAILRLIEPSAGSICFKNRDVARLDRAQMKEMRRCMQIVFQDPYSSLDPRVVIGDSIQRGLDVHHIGNPQERKQMVIDALHKVGLQEYHLHRYPYEFSGGQRQRIVIARALVLQPEFIICDEPVSALDVSIQSQVLNLLKTLQQELNLTYLFISHNLSVVEHISNRVAVMYLGKIVEMASKKELFNNPLHPYTAALLSAIPIADPKARRKRIILAGDVPSPLNPPSGCRFHPRCPLAMEICSRDEPELSTAGDGHRVACWVATGQK